MSAEFFETVFSLTRSQPWLKMKQDALIALISDCEDQEEQALVCDLLTRFTYLDGDGFSDAITKISSHVLNDLGLQSAATLISAREHSQYADSSQLVVYHLKTESMFDSSWTTNRFVSALSDIQGSGVEDVVLVDEFIGTGETMEKSVNYLRGKCAEWGGNFRIHCAVIAAMDFGLERVQEAVDSAYAVHCLSKGISDSFPATEVAQKLEKMLKLEATLASETSRGKLKRHSLGYKKSEALYSRHQGNTPNNVFPVFWWEEDNAGNPRKRMLRCR